MFLEIRGTENSGIDHVEQIVEYNNNSKPIRLFLVKNYILTIVGKVCAFMIGERGGKISYLHRQNYKRKRRLSVLFERFTKCQNSV